MRQTARLPFGSGVERRDGLTVVAPTMPSDATNVHLFPGRAEVRAGLAELVQATGQNRILAVHPIRSLGLVAVVTFNTTSREVTLYTTPVTPVALSLVGVLWTLPVGAAERVTVADSYQRALFAHDEPSIDLRQSTRVYAPATGAPLSALTLDLGGGVAPVAFRGVERHLTYIFGWGYGNNNDPDRPDLVRVSLPGQPTQFVPEHWFEAGARAEPVLMCRSGGGGILSVRKLTESHAITGAERRSFGIRLVDTYHGIAAPRLSVVVNGVEYFWSVTGPRRAAGAESADVGEALGLMFPEPSALPSAGALADGACWYDAERREVVWQFGQRGYVLHLAGESPEFSYRDYPVAVRAGVVISPAEVNIAPPSYTITASFLSGSTVLSTASETITARAALSAGGRVGDVIELWGRRDGGAWSQIGAVTLTNTTGLTWDVAGVTGRLLGSAHDYAMRPRRLGTYGAAYTSSDPLAWPAASRFSRTPAIPALAFNFANTNRLGYGVTPARFYHEFALGHNATDFPVGVWGLDIEYGPSNLGPWTSAANAASDPPAAAGAVWFASTSPILIRMGLNNAGGALPAVQGTVFYRCRWRNLGNGAVGAWTISAVAQTDVGAETAPSVVVTDTPPTVYGGSYSFNLNAQPGASQQRIEYQVETNTGTTDFNDTWRAAGGGSGFSFLWTRTASAASPRALRTRLAVDFGAGGIIRSTYIVRNSG